MADVQSDASQTPAPEAAPEAAPAPVAEAPTTSPEPAPAENLKEVVQAAADSTVEAVVDSAKSMASKVADAVGDVVEIVTKAASSGPELESTTLVPATEATGGSEGGGEWELLLGKVQAWLGQGKLQALWAQARNPISLILAAAALLLVLRVYSALLAAIDSLPLIPGLLELVGVIWAVRFGVPRLLQRSQRQELISSIQQRWESFRGRG
jgi:hypothetical protein